MKNMLFVLAAILLAGCNTPSEPIKSEAPSTTSTTQSTPPKPPAPDVHPDDIANRIYQLRDLQKASIKVGGHPLEVWIMDTPSKVMEGLMFVEDKHIAANQGMLFVFEDNDSRRFWMENTLIPLDITYIGQDKKVVNTVQGKPMDKTSLPSKGPAMYVLETKAGTMKRLGIKDGDSVDLPPGLAAKP
jgi:uncharacterized membrane protein (UPF0127 family)